MTLVVNPYASSVTEELVRAVARVQPIGGNSTVALHLSRAAIALSEAAHALFANARVQPRGVA